MATEMIRMVGVPGVTIMRMIVRDVTVRHGVAMPRRCFETEVRRLIFMEAANQR